MIVLTTVVSMVYESMVKYHDTVLEGKGVRLAGMPYTQVPNITSLAANGEASEAVKLGVVLVLISLLSERKHVFMDMFMKLEEAKQTTLMMALNPVCAMWSFHDCTQKILMKNVLISC